jgi:hypothetical protein
MRPVLALLVLAAAGFAFILQKKDQPEAPAAKVQLSELPKMNQHNWMRHALDTSRSVAKNIPKQNQGNEIP